MMFEEKYSYDDLLLVPQRSPVDSRSDVVLDTQLTPNITISSPLISAPMDSVTGPEMAQAMWDNGGVGILHRFKEPEVRGQWIEQVDGIVGASVGIEQDDIETAHYFENCGVDFICVDVAHGHMERTIDFVEKLNEEISVDIVAGNVATRQGVKDLVSAGADSVKVGVGSGSHCTTRTKTGHGVPQASVVHDCSNIYTSSNDFTIIADGGIREPGDAVKALMLGADSVMMGGIFGRCYESPGQGDVWGMASENGNTEEYNEGVVTQSQQQQRVSDVFSEFEDGIRSGLSYSGGHTIEEARKNSEIIKATESTQLRNGGFEV
jgi:IMP dehydrogenase